MIEGTIGFIGFLAGMGFAALIAMAWVQYDEHAKEREEAMLKRLTEELNRRQR